MSHDTRDDFVKHCLTSEVRVLYLLFIGLTLHKTYSEFASYIYTSVFLYLPKVSSSDRRHLLWFQFPNQLYFHPFAINCFISICSRNVSLEVDIVSHSCFYHISISLNIRKSQPFWESINEILINYFQVLWFYLIRNEETVFTRISNKHISWTFDKRSHFAILLTSVSSAPEMNNLYQSIKIFSFPSAHRTFQRN